MNGRDAGGWFRAGLDAWRLGAEASAVIGLRTARLAAGGDAAAREAALMVSEKVGAALELQADLLAAGSASTPLAATRRALRLYRGKVAANRRRLSR